MRKYLCFHPKGRCLIRADSPTEARSKLMRRLRIRDEHAVLVFGRVDAKGRVYAV